MVVILRFDGIDRTYECNNPRDAEVLHDALERRYGGKWVEMWDGLNRLR